MYFCFRSLKPRTYTTFRIARRPKGNTQYPKKSALFRAIPTIPKVFRKYATPKIMKNIREALKNTRKVAPSLVLCRTAKVPKPAAASTRNAEYSKPKYVPALEMA